MNFVCVLRQDPATKKHPGFYDKEWVNKLYRGIQRNYTKPFNFYCLSNVKTDVETIPLKNNFTTWWSKIELFRKDLPFFNQKIFYLDLDIVICNNFDNIENYLEDDKFYMLEGQSKKNVPNSSILSWQGDYSRLYTNFINNQNSIKEKYRKGNNLGDQGYIYDNLTVDFLNQKCPDLFSWIHPTHTKIKNGSPFCIFIGKKKPVNNLNLSIVKNNWG